MIFMHKHIRTVTLCLLMCLAMVLPGCTKKDSDIPTPMPVPSPEVTQEPKPAEPQEGGTLRLAVRTPLTLNPLLNEDVTVDRVLKLIFEPLATLDEHLKPVGNLVTMNFSSDYTSVTLTLRGDAIWEDGTPLSADDIIFSIETLRNAPDAAIYKHNVDNIASCEKLDNKTVKVTFVEIFGGSGYLFNFPVIPQHYYKNENKPSSEKNMTPLGNGLYMFTSYTPMKHLTLTQSPYTFRKRAYIENIEAMVIPDFETELYAFDQGLIDVISLELTEWSRHHSVKETHNGEYDAMYYDFIGFNFNLDIMNNKLFREALAHCIDIEALVPSIYLQHAVRTYSPVNPASWVYDAETPVYSFDITTAASLITQIRENIDDTPPIADDSETDAVNMPYEIPALTVLVNEENDERLKIAEALVKGMQDIGLDAEIECIPFDQFSARLSDGDFDIFIGGYNLSVIPDLSFAFHSDAITEGSNLLGYSDPEMDRLLRVAFSAGTENAYLNALSNVQRYIAEELPVISLVFRKSAVLTDTRVFGDIMPSADNIFANVNEWFIIE